MSQPEVLMLPLHRFIHSSWGSEWAWAINLARSIAAQSVDFTAVAGEVDQETRKIIRDTGNRLVELGVGRDQDPVSDMKFYSRLFRTAVNLVRKYEPRVIHHVFPLGYKVGFNPYILSHSTPPAVVGPLLLPTFDGAGEEKFMSYLGIESRTAQRLIYPKPLLSLLYRRTLLQCNHLIFDSETTRSFLLHLEPKLRDKKYSLLHSGGVDPGNYVLSDRPIERHPTTVTLGTLTYLRPKKHIATMIQAISQIERGSARIMIGGHGPMKPELQELARKIGVTDLVSFSGRISRQQVPSFLSQLDVVFSLHRIPHETMPSVQEAMMCGVPVIASAPERISRLIELPYGFLVDAESPQQVITAIHRFKAKPSLITEMGKKAREFALANFSMEAVGRQMLDIYEDCANSG